MINPYRRTAKENNEADSYTQLDDDTVAKNVVIYDKDGTLSLSSKFANHVDDYTTASVTYVGKESADGSYMIMKIDESGNFPVLTYASIANNPTQTTYSNAWTNRTTLTYNIYSTAF